MTETQVDIELPPLRDAVGSAPGGRAPADGDPACVRRFVNDGLNSQLTRPLPAGGWTVRARAGLQPAVRPVAVLTVGERIVVEGAGPWRLFDFELRPLAQGFSVAGCTTLDSAGGRVLFTDELALMRSARLSDGGGDRAVPLAFGREFRRTFVSARGSRLLAAGTERTINPHEAHEPDTVAVEVRELGDPVVADDDGLVMTSQTVGSLERKSAALVLAAALHGDTLLAALENRFLIAGPDLKVLAEFAGAFLPAHLSVDDLGRAHVLVTDEGGPRLWVLTAQGERTLSAGLPVADVRSTLGPPVIGFDRRIFVTTPDVVLAYSPEGRKLWEHRPTGRIAGATVTTDDQLLVAAGNELSALDAEGRRRVLAEFPGESLRTAPVLSAGGDLLVATDAALYRLTAG